MTSKTLKPTIIEPFGKHTATLIFLHGEGDETDGWAEKLAPLIDTTHIKLIFPKAAKLPISAYRGQLVPAWFDIYPQDYSGDPEDISGLTRSFDDVSRLIEREIKGSLNQPGIPASRIILGGFSQGGSIAFHTGINASVTLGGIINLSGHIPLCLNIKWEEVKKPPVMICQGDSDHMLPVNNLLAVSRILRNCLNVVFHIYDGVEHEACELELDDLKQFIDDRLPTQKG